jgi:predicted ABC-type ATPase
MPTLYLLAGPNGAGKTTYYFTALNKVFINHQLAFINLDVIAKDEIGGYSHENFAGAEMIYRERIKKLLKAGDDFMIESNLAKSSDYDWIEKMIHRGYEIILFFLCTDDVNININRVQRRIKEGGHDITPEIIIHRYKMSLVYLKGKLHLFKEVYFIDNSTDEAIAAAYIKEGKLTELAAEFPRWLYEVLFIFKKMKKG